jgi:hypothetical protein
VNVTTGFFGGRPTGPVSRCPIRRCNTWWACRTSHWAKVEDDAPIAGMTDARTIQELEARHRHVNSVAVERDRCQVWHDITDVMDPDGDLMAALEALRQHQLAKVDAQFAAFGIEPPAPKSDEQKPN